MTNFKWDIESIFSDIKRIEEVARHGNQEEALKDLRKISYMFNDPSNFNKTKRSMYVDTILQNIINRLDNNEDAIIQNDSANQLHALKHIGYISSDVKDIINGYRLIKNKRFFTYNPNELEIIFLIRDMFNKFDKGMLGEFDKYIGSSKLNITESKMDKEDCFTIVLRSIKKTYSSVVKCKNFNYIDGILYCYFKSKLFESNSDRELSVFNKTLEIFFTYLTANNLKSKGYKEFYDVKYNLNNQFKRHLTDFKYIVTNCDKIKYDFNENKYEIESSSSLFNGELVNYYNKGVSYKQMLEPFMSIYSNLLAIYLYQQNIYNKAKTVNDINIIINNMGLISDDELLDRLNIKQEDLLSLDYYNNFMNSIRDEYNIVKKKKRRG